MNGLPALANNLAAKGRYGDSMLMHVSPGEVRGLQQLAMANGGSLTINPHTGLPEAFKLADLLPVIAGIALGPAGLGLTLGGLSSAATAGLITGGLTGLATGDLGKGLMAGLGAYGGAGLGEAITGGAQAAVTPPAAPSLADVAAPGTLGGQYSLMPAADPTMLGATGAGPIGSGVTTGAGGVTGMGGAVSPGASTMAPGAPNAFAAARPMQGLAANAPATTLSSAQPGFLDRYVGAMGGPKGALAGGFGMASPFMQEEPMEFPTAPIEESKYKGPYTPTRRDVLYPTDEERRSSREFMYFSPSNPVPFQEGGEVAAAPLQITPAEAEVYRNIANIQQLAGLPSISNVPAQLMPSSVMSAMTPSTPAPAPSTPPQASTPFSTVEKNYGFEPLTKTPESSSVSPGGLSFYRQANFFGVPYGEPESFVPESRVDMANFYYDPALGGYVQKSQNLFGFNNGGLVALAGGGELLRDGSFVVDARTVSEIGNGSSNAGMEILSQMGGRPVDGPGDGVSDSVPAMIEGGQEARVARDEVIFDPETVKAIGGGNAKKGAQRLYALMDRAHEARKKAERGEDTGVGLGALAAA